MANNSSKYWGENGIHRVPLWRMGGFALNNLATNMYMFLMMYVAYYLVGLVGVITIVATSFSTIMRIWDGVTDPFVGLMLDKTNGKFGKNRPFLVIGNVILAITSFVLFHGTHLIGETVLVEKEIDGVIYMVQDPNAASSLPRLIFFVIVSALYYVGYTCQCVVTKSAQSCMTNDPKQRPLFSIFDSVFVVFGYVGIGNILVPSLVKKYGSFYSPELFHDLWVIVAIVSAILTVIAVISIAPKDKPEFFGVATTQQKIGLKEYWDTLKNNRAIQMLVVSASTDKLATSTRTSAVTAVLYGVIVSAGAGIAGAGAAAYESVNAAFAVLSFAGMIFAAVAIGTLATRLGQRQAMLIGSWGGIVVNTLLAALWLFGDPTSMISEYKTEVVNGEEKLVAVFVWGAFAIINAILTIVNSAFQGISGNIVIPMTADCADYEVYRTGKYVPGLMGTLFSFVDKLISSAAPMIAGIMFAMVGYSEVLPDVTSTYSQGLHYVTVFLMYGIIIIGLICNVIALKFYPLTKEKMAEIQGEIAAIKAKAAQNEQ